MNTAWFERRRRSEVLRRPLQEILDEASTLVGIAEAVGGPVADALEVSAHNLRRAAAGLHDELHAELALAARGIDPADFEGDRCPAAPERITALHYRLSEDEEGGE